MKENCPDKAGRSGTLGPPARTPADQQEVRECPTMFAVDETPSVVEVPVVHPVGAGHVRPPGSAGALAGRISQDAIEWDFPHFRLSQQA